MFSSAHIFFWNELIKFNPSNKVTTNLMDSSYGDGTTVELYTSAPTSDVGLHHLNCFIDERISECNVYRGI